jgi:hypothetical protein
MRSFCLKLLKLAWIFFTRKKIMTKPLPMRPLESIEADIEGLIRLVHPVELLCQLSMLHLMHTEDEHPDVEEASRWQVRIEFLTWIILHGNFPTDFELGTEPFIDATVLDPLEQLLDEYFDTYAHSLVPGDSADPLQEAEERLKFRLKTATLYVRGEGLPYQIEDLSKNLYSPHDAWMLGNLGFTIDDAFLCAVGIGNLLSENISIRRDAARKQGTEAKAHYAELMRRKPDDLTSEERQAVAMLRSKANGLDRIVARIECFKMFEHLRESFSFSERDLEQVVGEKVPEERAQAFLKRMAQSIGDVVETPDPLGFNPLAKYPLILFEERYYLPVMPLLYEALLSTFHFDLWGDPAYKTIYDKARSDWLEQEAVRCLSGLLWGSDARWSLNYGPKRGRMELDGLVVYDNKLLLIECKWKTLTLDARMGDIEAARTDIMKSIAASYEQAARARDYIRSANSPVTFLAKDGSEAVIDPETITEIYLLSLWGKGHLSFLAANPSNLVPLGLLTKDDYPWALSVTDLAVVCELLESPSQLFDYLKKRDAVLRDERFIAYDEWDLLGTYLHGHLDPRNPLFENKYKISLLHNSTEIDQYLRSKNDSNLPRKEKPGK